VFRSFVRSTLTVQQQISLLDNLLVLSVLLIPPVGLHHPVDLVDRAVQSTSRDQAREVAGRNEVAKE